MDIGDYYSDPVLEEELVKLYTEFRNKQMLEATKAL